MKPNNIWLTEPTAATSPVEPSPPSPSEPNSTKESIEKPVCDPMKKPGQVILRFDRCPDLPAELQRRCSRTRLHTAISKTLIQFFDETHLTLMTDLLAGSDMIWSTICPLLQLPEDFACPAFDMDEVWHSVVLHGIPIPRPDTYAHFTRDKVEKWITVAGGIRECTVLCCPEDLGKRTSLVLRLSLSSEAEAARLVREGGYLYGIPCRISHYVPKESRTTHNITPCGIAPSHPTPHAAHPGTGPTLAS
ncbi:hypothetical protein C8R45DRAFT_1109803 [Mycena sanguinolenta]|nr:hypothetical protein C8R45DRAFT_1109803 [Mycena sanguinolenta]